MRDETGQNTHAKSRHHHVLVIGCLLMHSSRICLTSVKSVPKSDKISSSVPIYLMFSKTQTKLIKDKINVMRAILN